MIEIIPLRKCCQKAYMAFLQRSQAASVYHTPEWSRVIQETYGYQDFSVAAVDEGNVVGVLPLFFVKSILRGEHYTSLPFSHFVPVLAVDSIVSNLLLDYVRSEFVEHSNKFIELHSNFDGTISNCRVSYNYINRIHLEKNIDELWRGLNKSSIVRSIKKAQKSNVFVDKSNDEQSYLDFYELQAETRRRQGAPMYPNNFFKNIYIELSNADYSRCYIARVNDKPIAGIVFLKFGSVVIYGYGASVTDHEMLALRPNHLLMWEAIKDCHSLGYSIFDLGSTPKNHESLLRYKQNWGSKTESLYYSFIGRSPKEVVPSRSSLAVRMVSRTLNFLPLSVNKVIGPFLMKQLG